MEEGGSLAKREEDNQQFPVTIGAIAGKAPDVEDSFLVQDMTADAGKEQAAAHGKQPTSAMPESTHNAQESVKDAKDSASQKVEDAKSSASESVEGAKDTVKGAADHVKEGSKATFESGKDK
ncbi:hypothetical protein SELMODRAFT_419683 [Selaginella moellendorffii]|uniref:Uncharacterized protein n=1 Tax=Selaginella moellendorffii TaxID=88036 RepID=D8S9Q0_SELML|nr:hypothetical protein SELMODRAFT_419683 [Selaginella moellendorffii]